MLTQNKKIIIYVVITMIVILIMIALSVLIINYLAREINQALTDKGVKATIKGFDFEALRMLGIEEINKILEINTVVFFVDIDGTNEGFELLQNTQFNSSGAPWFIWAQQTSETGEISISDGEVKVALKKPEMFWSAGIGQIIGGLDSGSRYRLSLNAVNNGGPSLINFQFTEEGQEVYIDGGLISVTEEMERHFVDFVVPQNLKFTKTKIILNLGELRNARIDNVSLRKIIPASNIATSTSPISSVTSSILPTSTTSTVSH